VIEPLAFVSGKCRPIALGVLAALAAAALPIHPAALVAGAAESRDSVTYVLLQAGTDTSFMSGSMDDIRRATRMRSGREGLLYARLGGTAYVIRDAATLRAAEAIFEPQRALGERQSELGSRQAALGARQAELGSRQAALGAQQARIGGRQAKASPDRAVALAREQEELGRQQDALGRQQDALGEQQDALGRQQDALGEQQDRLGREAEVRLRALLEDAIRSGMAQRVR
jgi:bla regulator protein blaR1